MPSLLLLKSHLTLDLNGWSHIGPTQAYDAFSDTRPILSSRSDWEASLAVQWLRLCDSFAWAQVQTLVGELRSCMSCGGMTKKKKLSERLE